MRRLLTLVILSAGLIYFVSCRNAETNADPERETDQTERPADVNVDAVKPAPSSGTVTPDSSVKKAASNEILAKIDQHLVSKPNYPATGGIVNATVTITNTLPNITFQKAIVQVTIMGSDGKELKSDFYTIQNLEPNDVETIKIPNETRGASMQVRIVKVKSNELTNGEMVMTGSYHDGAK
jgi:hypothetical protein